jgi:uncharacterized membrane protein YjgN (DUF898 family)
MAEEGSYFDGGALGFLGWSILCGFITLCTAGLCLPWGVCLFLKWETGHTVINGRRLRFTGSGGSLFGHYILWWFLSIITLGIYTFWLYVSMKKWTTKHTSFAS